MHTRYSSARRDAENRLVNLDQRLYRGICIARYFMKVNVSWRYSVFAVAHKEEVKVERGQFLEYIDARVCNVQTDLFTVNNLGMYYG